MDADMMWPLTPPEFTGERMIPEKAGTPTLWEHIYRYKFALKYTRGKDVLDIACGEGYGSASLLAAGAKSVIAVDIDPETVKYAKAKYKIDARVGDASSIPIANSSVDVVVSFETIEHITEPQVFISEVARVLRPGGCLIISTPNLDIYNPGREPKHNPFHCSEMTEDEFIKTVKMKFNKIKIYSQLPTSANQWSIRSLAVPDDPYCWRKVRGVTKMRHILSKVLGAAAEASVRIDTVGAILRHDPYLSRPINPYLVRPRSRRSQETPTYFVGVARYVKG